MFLAWAFPPEHKKLMFMFRIMIMLMIVMSLVGTKLQCTNVQLTLAVFLFLAL